MAIQLTADAIDKMIEIPVGNNEAFIIQVINIRKAKETYLKFDINDGTKKFKGMCDAAQKQNDLTGHQNSILLVSQHLTHQYEGSVRAIQLTKFKVISRYHQLIVSQPKLVPKTEEKSAIKLKPIQNKMVTLQIESQGQEVQNEKALQYERITDLFVNFQGWQLLVRLTENKYRQFTNKQNRLTKIMNLQFMDRAGWRIEAVMFGEQAKQYHQLLKVNHIYRVSRGQIRENSEYGQKNGDKYAKLSIILTANSQFIPVKNNALIPIYGDNEISVGQLLQETDFDRQYDVIGILTKIGEEKQIEKAGKIIIKQSLELCDPQNKKIIEVIIWNKNIKVDSKLQGKTVICKAFRLNSYRDQLSLCSTFKSEVNRRADHKYCAMEGKINSFSCDKISINQKAEEHDRICKSIKDLENQIAMMDFNEVIYSDLNVWLSHIIFKNKWFYNSCSKCKKGTEDGTNCTHCGTYNQNTISKFILPVELSDVSGSLYTTAFDQFASHIFKGLTVGDLKKIPEDGLKDLGEKKLFQQYIIRLQTKKEDVGKIKHTITGRIIEANYEKMAAMNVERIKRALYE